MGAVGEPGDYLSCLVGLPIAVQVRKCVNGTSGRVAGVKADGCPYWTANTWDDRITYSYRGGDANTSPDSFPCGYTNTWADTATNSDSNPVADTYAETCLYRHDNRCAEPWPYRRANSYADPCLYHQTKRYASPCP